MRFSSTVITLLLSALVSSNRLSFFGSQQVFDESLQVPGESPLEFCGPDRGGYILEIERVDITPNPPVPGQTLKIEAKGNFLDRVEDGAYIALQVKYGLIRLINTEADLCQQVQNVDLKCPIEKGEATISKTVDLPKEIPPGKYTVLADVYTKDDIHITCLTATVTFPA